MKSTIKFSSSFMFSIISINLLFLSFFFKVYSWGRGYCGALGHGNQNDKSSPELVTALKGQVAVQVGSLLSILF